MAATTLTFTGKNFSNQGWHFALYQKYAKELGLKSIAWKVLLLSKPQISGQPTQDSFSWNLNFQVAIANHTESGDVYVGGVTMDAKEGYDYEAVKEGEYFQIRETGKGTPGYINFRNSTTSKLNLGLEIGGSLMAIQEHVAGGVAAQFQITPTYYLGLFTNLKEGSFVSSDAAIGPISIKFPDGKNHVEVDAVVKEGIDSLTDPSYSYDGDIDTVLSKPKYAGR